MTTGSASVWIVWYFEGFWGFCIWS